jgi:hypothetical protein
MATELPPIGLPARRGRQPATQPRTRVRPLDDGTTAVVRVIEFVWVAGDAVQPVLMVKRELLH